MPEEAPVNIGALLERPYTVRQRVLGIQTKLHSWAAADPGRCFDDLFNLVVDPGFLVMAWTRVRENKGAKTAGIDGATAWSVENSERGVAGFLTETADLVEGPLVSSGTGADGVDSQGERRTSSPGHPHSS